MMEENKDTVKDVDFWATNSEEGGWNISSTDEGSQKMLDQEDEVMPIRLLISTIESFDI